MTSVDEHREGIRARGEDRESHGCARHAPAGGFYALPLLLWTALSVAFM